MRVHLLPIAVGIAATLMSCNSETKTPAPEPQKPAAAVKPADESRRFPIANQVDTQVVAKQLLGKSFMPGGTLARYRKAQRGALLAPPLKGGNRGFLCASSEGKTEYSMFVAKMPTAQDAAFLLLDWNKALAGSKLIPSFGGYFGDDAGCPVFVFAKGAWIAGIVGLPERDADLAARTLAAHLD